MSPEDATLQPQIVPAESAAAVVQEVTSSGTPATQKEIPKKQKVLLKCPYSDCTKEFKKQAHLDRHLSSHTKEVHCSSCLVLGTEAHCCTETICVHFCGLWEGVRSHRSLQAPRGWAL